MGDNKLKSNWRDRIFEQEYIREKARNQYRKDTLPVKKNSILSYIAPTAILFITIVMVFTFADVFGFSTRSLLEWDFIGPIVIISILFISLLISKSTKM